MPRLLEITACDLKRRASSDREPLDEQVLDGGEVLDVAGEHRQLMFESANAKGQPMFIGCPLFSHLRDRPLAAVDVGAGEPADCRPSDMPMRTPLTSAA